MDWITGIAVYLVIWWLVLFTVLPWGNRPQENPEAGHAPSAPALPRLRRKFMITTILAAFMWVAAFVMIKSDLIDFYQEAEKMAQEDR